YNTDLFDRPTIERMLDHFETLLAGIVAAPDIPVSQLALLDATERQHVLEDFNDSSMETSDTLVHQFVEAQAERTPDAPAVCFGDDLLIYSELNARANRLARALTDAGAGPGSFVGICAERSIETVVGVLAVLKAGAAYVPIDPAYPAERIATMLEDSQACVLLTQSGLVGSLPAHGAGLIELDTFDWASGDDSNPGVQGDSVYAIYTSGSTGKPKGVELTQAGLSNLIQWQAAQPGLDSPARTLQFASLSFDVSFQELFTTWAQGGALVLVTEDERRDLAGLAKFIATDAIERVYLPFAALQPLADAVVNEPALNFAVRDVIVAGEQLQITPNVKAMFDTLGHARLHNQYGPSETHVVTAYTLQGAPETWPTLPPIGVPVANTKVYVLDTNLEPVPVGVPGELYLGGVQVARGYVGRPGLTAETFVANPFDGGRMYRTGDRVHFLADGNLAYLGRTDDQVKWRGFRLEPGEIETTLSLHASVKQAAVLLREDTPGDKRLVAYVVGDEPDPEALRLHLKERLPDYMVPQAFVILDSLPLTPSGKLARRSLPVPDYADAAEQYVAPRTPIEDALTEIWADVLNVERVGIHDDFFALGGHSLLATQLISRVRDTLNIELALKYVFRNTTPETLAAAIESLQIAGSMTEATPSDDTDDMEEFQI
ncbi:MAG: amino acid adenylation domain-containing protein, partial [Gammaproteobacteria bacterium]|nr:amino acid adenylation domain-containing protein [Gammaproteobacteria bacterium]